MTAEKAAGASKKAGAPKKAAGPAKNAGAAKKKAAAKKASSDTVTITHPEKVLFPDDGITKGELAAYYEAIAPLLLPYVEGRPVTMERFPSGIGKQGFIHKDVAKGFPQWLERVEVAKSDGTLHHVIVRDVRSLLWITNQNTITPHVWITRLPKLDRPDVCVFDLDPAETGEPDDLRSAALLCRDVLTELGLRSWVKTSGSKGFHIVVPLDQKAELGLVGRFTQAVAALLVRRDPDHLTQELHKVDRGGRILVDVARNRYGATFAAAYAVRPKPGAPVSAPCTWAEVEAGDVAPQSFTLRTMAERVAAVGDLWDDMTGQSLDEAIAALRRM